MSSYFQINDIELTVPPTAISVHKENLEYSYKTLRTRVSTKVASGNGILHAQIGLVFAPEGILELHRLVCQIKNNPFVFIRNDYLAQCLGNTSDMGYFTVVGLNISNHPSAPDSFIAELDVRYFNEKPYETNLGFRSDLSLLKISNTEYELPFNIDSNNQTSGAIVVSLKEPEVATSIGEILESFQVTDPKGSNDYVAYSNFLQMMHLKTSFDISVDESNVLQAFGLVKDKQGKLVHDKNTRILGLHKILGADVKRSMLGDSKAFRDTSYNRGAEPITDFIDNIDRRTIVFGIRDFKEFKFPADISRSLRKEISKGVRRGMTVEQKEEIRKENARKIFTLLDQGADAVPGEKRYDTSKIKSFKFKTQVKIGEEGEFKDFEIEELTLGRVRLLTEGFVDVGRELERTIKVNALKQELNKTITRATAITQTVNQITGENSAQIDDIRTPNLKLETDLRKAIEETINKLFPYKLNVLLLKEIKDYLKSKLEIDSAFLSFDLSLKEQIDTYDINHEADFFEIVKKKVKIPEASLINFLKDKQNNFNEELQINLDDLNSDFRSYTDSIPREVKLKFVFEYEYADTLSFANLKKLIEEYKKYVNQYGYQPYSARYGYENILEGMVYHAFPVSNPAPDFIQTAITSISGGFKNLVTSIPILGQSFPTHQYMGGMEPMYQFNFIGKGISSGLPHEIKNLDSNIVSLALQNAKSFPGIPGASNIYVQSVITRLLGSTKSYGFDYASAKNRDGVAYISFPQTNFSVSSTDSFTIEGNPGAVGYNLRLSETKTYDDELLAKVKSNNINPKAYESLAQRIQNSATYARNLVKTKEISVAKPTEKRDWAFMNWSSKYFSHEDWYAKRSRKIRNTLSDNWKTVVTEEMDKNAYYLCVDYLDKIQDLITRAGEYYSGDYGFSTNPTIHLISTLDIPGGTRKSTSQHHFNAAADFVVKGMPCAFVVQIIELYSHYAFGDGGFKHTRFESATSGVPKDYGLGIYGRNSFTPEGKTIAEYYKPWLGLLSKKSTDSNFDSNKYKSGDGFIHIDLNLNESVGSFSKKDQYRRWVGETLGDRFCLVSNIDTSKSISDLVEEHYTNFNNKTLNQNDFAFLSSQNSVTKKLIQAELTLNTSIQDAGLSLAVKPTNQTQLATWESLHKDYSREVAKLFFPSYGNYRGNVNHDIAFFGSESGYLLLKEIIVNNKTDNGADFTIDIEVAQKVLGFGTLGGASDLIPEDTIEDSDAEETPDANTGKVTAYNLSKVKEIQSLLKEKNVSFSNVTLVPYSSLPDNLKETFEKDYKDNPTARFALIELEESAINEDVNAFIEYAKTTLQVEVKTGTDEDIFTPDEDVLAYPIGSIVNSINYNEVELERLKREYAGLFNGFQALASLILTEPSLYTNEPSKEYERIRKELYGTLVVPSFYQTVITLFAAPTVTNGNWKGEELSSNSSFQNTLLIGAEGIAAGTSIAAIAGGLALGPFILACASIALAGYGIYTSAEALMDLDPTEKLYVKIYETLLNNKLKQIQESEKGYKEFLDIDEELTQIEFQLAEFLKGLNKISEESFSHKDMYKLLLNKDTYGTGLDSFIKKIYSQIPVFEDFYKRGLSIQGASSLANLLTRKSTTIEEGNETYESFTVLSNEIVIEEIYALLRSLTEYPMVKASTKGRDASWIDIPSWANDVEEFSDLFIAQSLNDDDNQTYFNTLSDPSNLASATFFTLLEDKKFYEKTEEDYLFQRKDIVLNSEGQINVSDYLHVININNTKVFKEANKETLKKNNDKKLGFLKVIFESLLKDIALLEADKIREEDPALAAQVEELDLLDLVDKNLYPDIDLPKYAYTTFGYSDKYLPPYYYYFGMSNIKKYLDAAVSDNEQAVIEKTINDSNLFMNRLSKGIYSGPRPDLNLEIGVGHSNLLIDQDITFSGLTVAKFKPEDLKLNRLTYPLNVNTSISKEELESQVEALKGQTEQVKEQLEARKSEFNLFGDRLKAITTIESLNQHKRNTEVFKNALKGSRSVQDTETAIQTLYKNSGLFADQQDPLNDIKTSYQDFFIKDSLGIGGAFPTFKLFIVEEDAVFSDRLLVFDDFFSYNSVISFSYNNSRELPATTASIQLQNISGTLDGSKKEQLRDIDLDQSSKETLETEDRETIIDTVILRPGVNVQLRAGYGSNTRDLDILLSGRITEINYTADNTICNITVQSYGFELDTLVKANNSRKNTNNEFNTTHELLGNLLLSRELKHFGRIKKGRFFQIGESKDLAIEYTDFNKNYFNFSLTRSYMDVITSNLGLITFGVLTAPVAASVIKAGVKKFGFVAAIFEGVAKAGGWLKTIKPVSRTGRVLAGILIGFPALTYRATTGAFKALRTGKWFPGAARSTRDSNFFLRGDKIDDVAAALRTPAASRSREQTKIIENAIEAIEDVFTKDLGQLRRYLGYSIYSSFREVASLTSLTKNVTEATLETIIRNQIGFAEFIALGLGRGGVFGRVGVGAVGIFENFVGSFMFRNLVPVAAASVVPVFSLAVIDLIKDSAVSAYNAILQGFREARESILAKIYVTPQDDNIFCPQVGTYIRDSLSQLGVLDAAIELSKRKALSLANSVLSQGLTFGYDVFNVNGPNDLESILKNPLKLLDKRMDASKGENTYVLSNQSIWKLLHELSLRHPGYVYGTRPYGEGLEYRVFFGLPTQRYWSKPYSNSLINKMDGIYRALQGQNQAEDLRKLFSLPKIRGENENLDGNLLLLKAYNYWLNKTKDRYTSFRKYHHMTSERDIISNNIIVSGHNVINAVSVHYKYRDDPGQEWRSNETASDGEGAENIYTHKMVGSSSINESNLREKEVRFDNIKGIANAVRYGTGELVYGAKNMYEGSLLILGNTKINPWDIIILNDNVTNMHGPLEVKAVTHTFSYETGFITDVEVNALVTATEKENYPGIISSLVFEARKELYDKYSNRGELSVEGDERKVIENTIREALEKAIKDARSNDQSFLANKTIFKEVDALFLGTDPEIENAIKNYLIGKSVDQVKDLLDRKGEVSFVEEVLGGNVAAPVEVSGLLSAGAKTLLYGSTALTGLRLIGGAVMSGRFGLSNVRGVIPAGLTTAALLGASALGGSELIAGNIASSFNSGYLGKNFFRKQIFSRMTTAGVIQIYPLVRDGLPLLAGGYEEVSASERWNNITGNIFNDLSDATEGYYRRLREYNSLGKEALYQAESGDYGAFTTGIALTARGIESLGLGEAPSIFGYFLSDEEE
jgi:hypothetical protein